MVGDADIHQGLVDEPVPILDRSVKLRDEGNSNPPRAGFDVNGFADHASVKILNSRIDIDEGDTGSVDGNVNLLLFQILG